MPFVNGKPGSAPPWNKGISGYKTKLASEEQKLKLSLANSGRPKTAEQRAKQSAAMKGRVTQTREQRRAVVAKHNSLERPDCRCYVHGGARPYMISSYTWLLAEVLVAAGFDTIIPEAQFGLKRVDVLLGDDWLAFEADGAYHFSAERRAYDAQRDRWLLDNFELPVVRLSGREVQALHRELVKGGDAI